MCRRVQCRKCGRPDWAGCGAHIEQVLGNIPKSERCQCRESAAKDRAAGGHAGEASAHSQRSWLSRLLGN